MILRVIFFLVLFYLVFLLLYLFLAWHRRRRTLRSQGPMQAMDEMVLDPQCQSYLPKSEAIHRGGHYFCSQKCADLYLSKG